MKWKKDYIANRIEFNDEFIEESIERTVAAIGFNSKVRIIDPSLCIASEILTCQSVFL